MLEMILKTLISCLDLKIEPAEVEKAWHEAKTKIPEMAARLAEESARASRIEALLIALVLDSNHEKAKTMLKELYPNAPELASPQVQ